MWPLLRRISCERLPGGKNVIETQPAGGDLTSPTRYEGVGSAVGAELRETTPLGVTAPWGCEAVAQPVANASKEKMSPRTSTPEILRESVGKASTGSEDGIYKMRLKLGEAALGDRVRSGRSAPPPTVSRAYAIARVSREAGNNARGGRAPQRKRRYGRAWSKSRIRGSSSASVILPGR